VKKSLKIALLLMLIAARIAAQIQPDRGVKIIVTVRQGIFDSESRMPKSAASVMANYR
jgi:hypothetical protein